MSLTRRDIKTFLVTWEVLSTFAEYAPSVEEADVLEMRSFRTKLAHKFLGVAIKVNATVVKDLKTGSIIRKKSVWLATCWDGTILSAHDKLAHAMQAIIDDENGEYYGLGKVKA